MEQNSSGIVSKNMMRLLCEVTCGYVLLFSFNALKTFLCTSHSKSSTCHQGSIDIGGTSELSSCPLPSCWFSESVAVAAPNVPEGAILTNLSAQSRRPSQSQGMQQHAQPMFYPRAGSMPGISSPPLHHAVTCSQSHKAHFQSHMGTREGKGPNSVCLSEREAPSSPPSSHSRSTPSGAFAPPPHKMVGQRWRKCLFPYPMLEGWLELPP